MDKQDRSDHTADVHKDVAPAVTITHLRFEQQREAFGIDTTHPRLSWIIETALTGWYQAAYEIAVYGAEGDLLHQTGHVEADQSVLVPWPYAALTSRERLTVQVRVWGNDRQVSDWSAPATVEMGLLAPEDWSARFVTPDWQEDITRPQPAPQLRHNFDVSEEILHARLYVTALGVYEVQINGQVVGDQVLAPGWTSYTQHLCYQTFDVTDLLSPGRNAIGAILGDGWYRGRLGFGGGTRNIYGEHLALLAQLEITYADGSSTRVVTDNTWHAAQGPLLSSDLYDGESYDARLEQPGWSGASYDDQAWMGVRVLEHDLSTLVAPPGPPIRRIEELAPAGMTSPSKGHTIIDFGQNIAGRLRIRVRGVAGQVITLRHAEVLENGELSLRPLRHALATDRYTLKGEDEEIWEPRFTFHGFRYAEIAGWPGTIDPEDIRAIVCHSDMERSGWFECSDRLLNRLHENVIWSMRGNFLSIPSDCPQRDERLGWTGDIQIFAPTASFLYDTAGFLTSWLTDVAIEQASAGMVPFIVPNILTRVSSSLGGAMVPTAAWGDAAVLVPWTLYQRYGDAGILATQFESMRAWVDLLATIAGEKYLWDQGFQFGDWLDPSAPPDNPAQARTDPYVVATAYFAHSAKIVGQTANIIGQTELATHYLSLAAHVRDAFDAEYITPNGRVLSDSATAYALAIQFDLFKRPAQRSYAGTRLATLIREGEYHITTGFVGTPLICDALCNVGAYDVAYRLLTQRECPSWLYPVTMGATTIWERWDSMLPDGSVNPGEMTSFNHYAFGAVADWLQRTVAGLAPAEPGYRHIAIQPHPGGGLTHARASLHTPYGLAESSWALENGTITIIAIIPPSTTASVILPGNDGRHIKINSGKHIWSYRYL